MKGLVCGAVVAVLIAPAASQAQSPQQKAELAAKLLATVQKDGQPSKSTYAIIGTATVGSQTRVYVRQEIDIQDKKTHINFEYTCTFLDGGAGWICAPPLMPQGLIFLK
jgi:hypothetical protein